MALYWKLINKLTVPCSLEEWAVWMEKRERVVGKTDVGPYRVSTVFLGIDHSFGVDGPPILFETMIFHSGKLGKDVYCTRCSTWDEAEKMHKQGIELAKRNTGITSD